MNTVSSFPNILEIEAKGIPQHLKGTYELIRQGASINPKAPALSFFMSVENFKSPETWTYEELFARITQTANFFHALGAKKDTVIAIALPNLPETHLAIWGGEATGTIVVLNPLMESSALEFLLEASKAEILVTMAPFSGSEIWQKLQSTFDRLPALKHVVTINLSDHVRGVMGLAAKFIQFKESFLKRQVPSRIKLHDFSSKVKSYSSSLLDSKRTFSSSDSSSWFCTGGTTGLPKIAMRSHGNEVSSAVSVAKIFGEGMGPGKVFFCGLPLFHVNAVLITGLVPFSQGAHVVLAPPQGYRTPGLIPKFWEIVDHYKVNFFSGVPTIYSSLLQVPVGPNNIGSLEYGLCGAAPMPIALFQKFENMTGVKILEGYGLTEGTCVSSLNPPAGERKIGSVGFRIPFQELKIVKLNEDGIYQRECSVEESGSILISGQNVFDGYLNPVHNKGIWVDCGDGRKWLNTGDLGSLDKDNYLWLTGRKKELIIRGGHNIDPASIEGPLHKHPAVQVAAAVGRPDAHAGELPIAYIQLKPGSAATEEQLMEYLQEHIGEKVALPKHVRILKEIPLTAVGKIYKPALKCLEIRYVILNEFQKSNVLIKKIDVKDDKTLGIVAEIQLTDPGNVGKAKQALEPFTFKFVFVS